MTADIHVIRDILVQKGEAVWHSPRAFINFTHDDDADKLLNDLEAHPHAFVIACIMDRQMKAEAAWRISHLLAQKLGSFSFSRLPELSLDEIDLHMTVPTPLHRFPTEMARNIHEAVSRLAVDYEEGCFRAPDRFPRNRRCSRVNDSDRRGDCRPGAASPVLLWTYATSHIRPIFSVRRQRIGPPDATPSISPFPPRESPKPL